MKILSFFSGCGGLDLGFKKAGFEILYANEFDKKISETYLKNHKNTFLDTRSITELDPYSLPDCDGIIGGPPCQSWSAAGSKKGIEDKRGKLFFNFIEIIRVKKPLFFVAENVPGILSPRNKAALDVFIKSFENCGYNLKYETLNASNFNIAQDRKRVIFIGIRKDILLNINNYFPNFLEKKKYLKDVIFDLKNNAVPAILNTKPNKTIIPNHEYVTSTFSPMFMSRNRIRKWDDFSFTIQAGGRHAPLHPDSGSMILESKDKFIFTEPKLVRRLSIRECARIQGFPDDFIFYYKDLMDGYKMVGNAVPVDLAFHIGMNIRKMFNS